MENKALKKIIVIAIVFMIIFSNCGFTLQVLATSEGISFMGFNLFKDDYLGFNAYFLDSNNEEHQINYADVNDEMTLVVELEPKEEGYLKSGTIKAVAEEGEESFSVTEVLVEEVVEETLTQVAIPNATLLKTEQVVEESISNSTENETVQNIITEDAIEEIDEIIETVEEQEDLVDEDVIVQEKSENEQEEVQIVKNEAEAIIVSDNEIEIKNIIETTKLYIKFEFNPGEKLNVESLYQKISLEFAGKYIDIDLQEIEVTADRDLELGWEYSKDFEIMGEYTKVSPFEVVGTKGTIVENKITLKRDIEDEKYLPIKQTKLEIEVPEIEGKKPVALEVEANKLKATKGEDINEVVFTNENWTYNKEANILTIIVENNGANYTYGEDIYIVTYRYDNYVNENEIDLELSGKVTVEEFSGKENNVIEKEINETQKIIANVGELITYSIGTTEDKINKAKINANYNSVEAKYETEFITTVNISVLTNDVLKEFILKDTKEFYIDNQNLEFETQDVKYKKIVFKYEEITKLLEKGGSIEIKNNSGEVLYILNKDLVKSQEDCEIEINEEIIGLEISVKDISVNGNISVNFVKAIGKCSFDKSAFKDFEKLESRIKAEVKYESEEEQGTELKEIKTEKYFEDSYTRAEIELNTDSLSTIGKNENVEIKIQLNNHLETSDLYVNPVFEIVFPKYVKNVEPKVTNLLYEDELELDKTEVYVEDGLVKMRVALKGAQTKFSTGILTNGTNIIINTNIEVDEYTPRKDDQIKMYYYNEGVTNYESQTKWKLKSGIPTGILKTTNGFDIDVFTYQAPSGFVLINEIENYDGQNSKVTSIYQGTETREVAMEKEAQVATMNLIAINNTENECTDVIMLGRIPSKNATDVKTLESLENNVDTLMKSPIVASTENTIDVKIYYSANANATKDLNAEENGWTEVPEDIEQIKSFLVMPIDNLPAETVLKFSYDFEIPENLPYEAVMFGSFGAFYNNHSEVAITSEIVVAEKVGLTTKPGPKVEAIMSVDIGDGADIGEKRLLTYTLTVLNSGSITAEDITVINHLPKGSILYEEKARNDVIGYGWNPVEDIKELTWNIEKLEPEEVKTFTYTLKTPEKQEDEELYITNKAKINVPKLTIEVESNEITNQLINSNFDMEIYSRRLREVNVGQIFEPGIEVKNISGETVRDAVLKYRLPEEVAFESFLGTLGEKELNINNTDYKYNSENHTLTIQIPEWLSNEILNIGIISEAIKGNADKVASRVSIVTVDGKEEISSPLNMIFTGPYIEGSQTCSAIETIGEGEYIEFITSIKNTGNEEALKTTIYTELSENLVETKVELLGASTGTLSTKKGYIEHNQYSIPIGEELNLKISGKVKEVDDDNSFITSKVMVINDYVEDIDINEISIKILNTSGNDEETEDTDNNQNDQDNTENDNQNNQDNTENNNQNNQDKPVEDNKNDENKEEETSKNETSKNETSKNETSKNETSNNETSKNEVPKDESTEKEDTSNDTTQKETEEKYSISGKVWLDLNKNGIIDEEEKGISEIEVQLQNENKIVKSIKTSKDGIFKFEDLRSGSYTVIYVYDEQLYNPTTYKAIANRDDISSSARKVVDGKAVTNSILVTNNNIVDINLGLQEKNKANLTVAKYITSAKVTTKKGETIHEYENLDLAKLEIHAKEIEGAVVELNYSIIIKNEGSVNAKAVQVVDYLPKDTSLNLEKSKDWYLGTDGNAYNDTLKDLYIKPGEEKTLNIVLTKNMTGENTGVLSNKIEIKVENDEGAKEIIEDNISTQETIISIKTGYGAQISISIIVVTGAVIIVYLVMMRKIKIDVKNFKIHRIYK